MAGVRHRIIPLETISNRDGWIEVRCLECGKPIAPQRYGYRHYQGTRWTPRNPTVDKAARKV